MEQEMQTTYWGLPQDLKIQISRYLDLDTLLALSTCDPGILTVPALFASRIKDVRFKRTFTDLPRDPDCSGDPVMIVERFSSLLGYPPFLTKDEYLEAFNHNKIKIDQLMNLVEEIGSQDPFLKKPLLHQLALRIMQAFSNHGAENTACTLCYQDRQAHVCFQYRGVTLCYTDPLEGTSNNMRLEATPIYLDKCINIDGWNLLVYLNMEVTLKSCNIMPHPVELAHSPMTWGEHSYHYPSVEDHELMYKGVISGMELKSMYLNIKRKYISLDPTASHSTPHIDAHTIILYTLEGAMAFFAALEHKTLLSLSFQNVIHDPRGQTSVRSRESRDPKLVQWFKPVFYISRTKQIYTEHRTVRNFRKVYHLMADYSWKIFHTHDPRGPSGRIIISDEWIVPMGME